MSAGATKKKKVSLVLHRRWDNILLTVTGLKIVLERVRNQLLVFGWIRTRPIFGHRVEVQSVMDTEKQSVIINR